MGVDDDAGFVGVGHLTKFNKDDATRCAAGCMLGVDGVANVGADWVITVFIGEGAVEDEKLFTAAVNVGREGAARRVADNRGGASDFATIAVERFAFHTL